MRELLGFEIVADELGADRRRTVVAPRGGAVAALVLTPAVSDEQRAAVGRHGWDLIQPV